MKAVRHLQPSRRSILKSRTLFHKTPLQPTCSRDAKFFAQRHPIYLMNSATAPWPPRVVPAQLAFLAIYNPSFGPTDDSFPDQLVFHYSRAEQEERIKQKKNRSSGRRDGDRRDGGPSDTQAREAENERLRQIGLAQGMVDFAR